MEYIRSLRTGTMEEYPVMSTSQGTYVPIEQTSEAIRVRYEICSAGGARTGIENRWTNMQKKKKKEGGNNLFTALYNSFPNLTQIMKIS